MNPYRYRGYLLFQNENEPKRVDIYRDEDIIARVEKMADAFAYVDGEREKQIAANMRRKRHARK